MNDERVQRLLRDHARNEWSRTPDLWPSIEASLTPSATQRRRSLPWELGKMAAGAAVVIVVGVVLAAVFSTQQGALPGTGEDNGATGSTPVTEGEALIYRWDVEQERYDLVSVDVRSGEPSDRIPSITLGSEPGAMFPVGVSSTGSQLAVVSADESIPATLHGGTQTWPRANLLSIVDTNNGEITEIALPDDGWIVPVMPPLFSPDGESVVLSYERDEGSTIMLFDLESGNLIEERQLGERIAFIDFTSEGDQLIVYSQAITPETGSAEPEPPHIRLLDTRTLGTDWSEVFPDITSGHWCTDNCVQDREIVSWNPGIAFDHQRQTIYVAHIDQPVIDVIDINDRAATTFEYEISPDPPGDEMSSWMRGGFGTLRVDPVRDQLYLMTGGRDAFTLGWTVIDLEAGTGQVRVSGNVPESGVPAQLVEVTPDGSAALLAGDEYVARYDLEHDQIIDELVGWSVRPSRTLDGEPILLASDLVNTSEPKLGVIDPESLEVVAEWKTDQSNEWALVLGWSRVAGE